MTGSGRPEGSLTARQSGLKRPKAGQAPCLRSRALTGSEGALLPGLGGGGDVRREKGVSAASSSPSSADQ